MPNMPTKGIYEEFWEFETRLGELLAFVLCLVFLLKLKFNSEQGPLLACFRNKFGDNFEILIGQNTIFCQNCTRLNCLCVAYPKSGNFALVFSLILNILVFTKSAYFE